MMIDIKLLIEFNVNLKQNDKTSDLTLIEINVMCEVPIQIKSLQMLFEKKNSKKNR